MNLEEIVAKNIRTLRELRGLSQEELARRSSLSAAGLRSIEYAHRWPRGETLQVIAQQLGVPASLLLSENLIPESAPPSDEEIVKNVLEKYGFSVPKLKRRRS